MQCKFLYTGEFNVIVRWIFMELNVMKNNGNTEVILCPPQALEILCPPQPMYHSASDPQQTAH